MRPFACAMAGLAALALLCVASSAPSVEIPSFYAAQHTADSAGSSIDDAGIGAMGFRSTSSPSTATPSAAPKVSSIKRTGGSEMETTDIEIYQTFKYAAGYPSAEELILVADGMTISEEIYYPALYSGLDFPIGDSVQLQIGRASDSAVLWEGTYPIEASDYPYTMASVRLEDNDENPVFWTSAFTLNAATIDPTLETKPVLVVMSLVGPDYPYDVWVAPKAGGDPARLVEDADTFVSVSDVAIKGLDEDYWDCYVYFVDRSTLNTTGAAEATFEPGKVYYMIWTEYPDTLNGYLYSPIIQTDEDAGSFVSPGGLLTTAALALAAVFASRQL